MSCATWAIPLLSRCVVSYSGLSAQSAAPPTNLLDGENACAARSSLEGTVLNLAVPNDKVLLSLRSFVARKVVEAGGSDLSVHGRSVSSKRWPHGDGCGQVMSKSSISAAFLVDGVPGASDEGRAVLGRDELEGWACRWINSAIMRWKKGHNYARMEHEKGCTNPKLKGIMLRHRCGSSISSDLFEMVGEKNSPRHLARSLGRCEFQEPRHWRARLEFGDEAP